MRKLLLLPFTLWACGGAKEAPPPEAAASAALTAADVSGSYIGSTTAEGTDSVLGTWTSRSAANDAGAIVGSWVDDAAPADTVAMTGTIAGDSAVWISAPHTQAGAAAGSPQLVFVAMGRALGNAWTGTVVISVAGTDSVVQRSNWRATRAP